MARGAFRVCGFISRADAGEFFVGVHVHNLELFGVQAGDIYRRLGSSSPARAWSCAMPCLATFSIEMPVSPQRRATHQRASAIRSLTSLLCAGVRWNLPDANATDSSLPSLPAASCKPKTGSSIRTRSFRKAIGTFAARSDILQMSPSSGDDAFGRKVV